MDKYSGTCWAVGAITSLAASPIGVQMIKDAMTFNDDGSVTVTFKGADNRSYTITKEDMEVAQQNLNKYSPGDKTMLVLLAATEKLRKDMNLPAAQGWLNGGSQRDMIFWLTGKNNFILDSDDSFNVLYDKIYDEQTNEYIKFLSQTEFGANNGQSYIRKQLENMGIDISSTYTAEELFKIMKPGLLSGDVILNIGTIGADFIIPTQPNGELAHIRWLGGGHAWGVKNITEDTVTLWDLYQQTEYTVLYEDLLNSDFRIEYTIIGDYENPSKDIDWVLREQTMREIIDFDSSNISRDKTGINDIACPGTSMTFGEIINSSQSIPLNFEGISPDGDFMGVIEKIQSKVFPIIKTMYTNMTGYTDYKALNKAYEETCSYFNEIIVDFCRDEYTMFKLKQYIEYGKHPTEALMELGFNIDANSIVEKFMSYLSMIEDNVCQKKNSVG
jgi:hypothetical protein